MKIAVIGANGQLGMDIVDAFRRGGDEVVELDHSAIHIEEMESCRSALPADLDAIVSTAAMHHVDKCEADPAQAYAVNAIGGRNLALAAAERNAKLVYVSTDYVFDGAKRTPYEETDAPNPLNVYGNTKLAGEHYVRTLAPKHFVLRVSALFGKSPCRAKGGLNFVELMLKLAKERGSVRVVDDEFVSPTSTADVARQIARLLPTEHYGLFHCTAEGQCSWHDFAAHIFEVTGTEVKLERATPGEFPAKVPRPKYSVLENAALERAGLNAMRHWRDAVNDYLGDRCAPKAPRSERPAVAKGLPMAAEVSPRSLLERSLADGDIARAIGVCRRQLEREPGDAFFLESLADIYAIVGASESAAVLYKSALELSFDATRLEGKLRNTIAARSQRAYAAVSAAPARATSGVTSEPARGSIDNVTYPSWTSRFCRYDTASGEAAWGVAAVDGWAIADAGVDRVEILVDGASACAAVCSFERPDVGKAFPGATESLRSGFRARLDTGAFSDGKHVLALAVRSRTGETREVSRKEIAFDNSSAAAKNLSAAAQALVRPSEVAENAPFKLGISLSSKCNLRCVMCRPKDDGQEVKDFKAVNMPMEVFEKLKPFIPRAFVIIPQGFGEPMMHPQFDEILPAIRVLNDRAIIIFTSNGTLLNQRRADLLIDAHASIIEVSLDSLNPETYRYIRRGSELSRVLHNLDYLAEAKAKKNAPAPLVRLKFVVMRQTVAELPSFVRYAVEHGINHVFLSDVEPFYTSADQFTIDHDATLDHYLEARELARSHGVFLDGTSISTFEAARARRVAGTAVGAEVEAAPEGKMANTFGSSSACPDPFSTMLVETTGDVTVCCFSGGGVLGNVMEEDIEALWNGQKYRALRRGFTGGELAKECAYCVKRGIVPEVPYEMSLLK